MKLLLVALVMVCALLCGCSDDGDYTPVDQVEADAGPGDADVEDVGVSVADASK